MYLFLCLYAGIFNLLNAVLAGLLDDFGRFLLGLEKRLNSL